MLGLCRAVINYVATNVRHLDVARCRVGTKKAGNIIKSGLLSFHFVPDGPPGVVGGVPVVGGAVGGVFGALGGAAQTGILIYMMAAWIRSNVSIYPQRTHHNICFQGPGRANAYQ